MARRKAASLAVAEEEAASSARVAVAVAAPVASARVTATPAEIAATPSSCPDR